MAETQPNINADNQKKVSAMLVQLNERFVSLAKYTAEQFEKLAPQDSWRIPAMSPEIDKITEALSKAQGEYPELTCNRGGHHSRYADIEIMLAAVRKPFKENGLAVFQRETAVSENTYILNTTISHKSGQFLNSSIMVEISKVLKTGKTDLLQQFGSDMSYHKRYALQSILGIAPIQDGSDDNAGYKEEQGKGK